MRTIAIGSGKGGVGKTSLTANLAVLMSRQGHRVVAMDADFGLANLDVMMGLPSGPTLRDLLDGTGRIESVLRSHPCGARVLAGCSGVAELADLDPLKLDVLLGELRRLELSTDVLLIDLAAGVHDAAISTLVAADEAIIVLNGDPASFVDAYATIKRIIARNPSATIKIVANEVEDASKGKLLFARLQAVVREHLDARLAYVGAIRRDEALAQAVLRRSLVVDRTPEADSARDILAVAETLVPGGAGLSRSHSGFFSRLLNFRGRLAKAA